MSTQVLDKPNLQIFDQLESEVRSYCRSFSTVFKKAKDHKLWDTAGREYIDFFAGAGSLNYGHNNEKIKQQLVEYILSDGITHSLDMATEAKERFLIKFHTTILQPRALDYKVMFPGPTGTNAVESALKIARKVTGRETIISFTNAFHGMTVGSLSITGNTFKRKGAGMPLYNGVFMPFDKYFGEEVDTADYLERLLDDSGSGVEKPAAIIFETVQGEGGVNVASVEWMRKVADICQKHDILLIVDDVQMGCGRTGTFFSFESAGIIPDIVCLSKSIGGIGLPFALTLLKPEIDIWAPGEHNGTFRGNNLAFVAAAAALDYWKDDQLTKEIRQKSETVKSALKNMVDENKALNGSVRGRGLIYGVEFAQDGVAEQICGEAFSRGLIMETSGSKNEVAKLLPPLTIDSQGLEEGLQIMADSMASVNKKYTKV